MGLLSNLLGIRSQTNTSNDSYGAEVQKCLIPHKLKHDEFDLFSLLYYQGYTSYRDFFKYVFDNNISKMKKIVRDASKKASEGCNIDFTFIRFYKDDNNYLDIPLDVFTSKKNMSIRRRNTKIWNKINIKRLVSNNPNIRNFDDSLISETIKNYQDNFFK